MYMAEAKSIFLTHVLSDEEEAECAATEKRKVSRR